MATVDRLTTEELEELEKRSRELPELQSVGWQWDFAHGRVTISQKQSRFAIHPAEVTLTFETLTLAYYMLLKVSLEASGIMQQMGPVTVEPHKPSGGTSESPRSHTARGLHQ